jgi:hypothetical protein
VTTAATTATDPFLTAALAAAARGWHVVPLRPGTKKPAFHGYDRCPRTGPCIDGHRGWEQRALSDPGEIRWYWTSRRGQGCNVGIATGPSRLLVVDLDLPKPGDDPRPAEWDRPDVTGGEDVFLLVCDQHGQVPPVDTYTVRTASGGTHLYYAVPDGVQLRNTGGPHGAGLGWKVDTRAGGGQVVAPGSVVNHGGRPGRYTVALDVPVAPVPGWLADRLAAPPSPPPPTPVRVRHRSAFVDAAVRDTVARVKAAKSDRNAALYGGAVSLGQLVAGGQLSEREHAEALMDAASRHISVGAYSARQAASSIASGLRKGMQRPRQVAA